MTPPNTPSNDPNRIDVALQMVGDESARAIDNLTAQVEKLTGYLNTQGGATAGERLAHNQATAINPRHGIRGAAAGSSHSGALGAILDDAGMNSSHPDAQYLQRANLSPMRRLISSKGRREGQGFIGEQMGIMGARERSQQYRRDLQGGGPDYENHSIGSRNLYDSEVHGGGTASSSASTPGRFAGESEARYNLRANRTAWERGQEGFEIPQFGEYTIQNKLNMAADYLQRSGDRKWKRSIQEAEDIIGPMSAAEREYAFKDVGQGRFNSAGFLRMAAEQSGQATAVMSHLRGGSNFIGGLQSRGIQAGFDRGGTWGPIMNPLSAATREGIRQKWNETRLRLKGGINQEEAQSIVGGLVGEGFSGSEGQNLAFDAVAPLVQQGQDPLTVTSMLSQAVRNSATPVKEFVKTMSDLGPAAQAARMTIEEYSKALDEFANNAQGMGATYGEGLKLGRNLSSSLGMAPQLASAQMNNPLVQGFAMRNGYLPQTMGLMGARESMSAINTAVDTAWQATAGFEGQDITDPVTGHVTTGEEQRAAMAAQIYDPSGQTSPDVFLKLQRNKEKSTIAATALDQLDTYTQARKEYTKEVKGKGIQVKRGGGRVRRKITIHDPDKTVVTDPNGLHQLDYGDLGSGPGGWSAVNKSLDDLVNAAPEEDREKYRKRIAEISKYDPEQRNRVAREFINNRMKEGLDNSDSGPTVYVKFKGKAAKYFEQADKKSEAKRDSDSGSTPINSFRGSPRGAETNLNDLTNSLEDG